MAELGSIDFVQTSGAPVGDTSREQARAVGAFADSLDAIKKYKANDVLASFRGEANELVAGARDEAKLSNVFEGASTLEGEPGRINRRVKGLAATIQRGSRSQRGLAELELKKLLNQTQETYPSLARELQQQYGMVVSANHQLDEIGMIDQLATVQSKQAQAEWDAIVKQAHALPENGGLGIDPSIPVGSAEFARQYSQKQQIQNLKNARALDLTLALTAADMSFEEKAPAIIEGVRGKGNIIDEVMARNADLITRYHNEKLKPEGQQDIQFMQDFATTYRDAMVEQLNFTKQEILGLLNQAAPTPEQRAGDAYARTQLVVEDEIARLDAAITAISGDDPDAMELVLANNRVRSWQMRLENKGHHNFMTQMNPGTENVFTALEAISKLDVTGAAVIAGQRVANIGLMNINEMLNAETTGDLAATVYYSSGQGTITDGMDPQRIQNQLRNNWSQQDGFYGMSNVPEEEDLKKSLAHIEMLRRASYSAVETNSPATAGMFMTDAANAFMVMDAIANPSEDQVELTTQMLSDPKIVEAAMLEGNGANRNRRMALGMAAQDFYANVEPASQMRKHQQALEQPFMGARIKDFVQFIPASQEISGSTEMTYEIRQDYLRDQLNATLGGGIGDAQIEGYTKRIHQRIQPLMNAINTHIRANAHVDALNAPTIDENTVDYINMADQLGWVDYLMGP